MCQTKQNTDRVARFKQNDTQLESTWNKNYTIFFVYTLSNDKKNCEGVSKVVFIQYRTVIKLWHLQNAPCTFLSKRVESIY